VVIIIQMGGRFIQPFQFAARFRIALLERAKTGKLPA